MKKLTLRGLSLFTGEAKQSRRMGTVPNKKLAIAIILAMAFPVHAGMQHDHSSMKHEMETIEERIGGYDVSFDIMTHKDYQVMMKMMKMGFMAPAAGTTHHIAVSIYKDKNRIVDAAVNMKVISPDGSEETRMLTYNPDMMYQYVGHFSMQKKGRYQVLILFKAGEERQQGGIYYEVK